MKDVFKDTYCIILSVERLELNRESNAKLSSILLEKLINIVQWDGQVIPSESKYKDSIEQSYTIIYPLNDFKQKSDDSILATMYSVLMCADSFNANTITTVVNGEATVYELDNLSSILTGNMEMTTDTNVDYTKINNTLYTIV